MPSPIYQDMVNLIVGVPIWRCPSIFMNVAMLEHCTFDEVHTLQKTLYVSCAKGYDCCVRFVVRISRKTLYLSALLRDMIAV
jgi:hypothetical protein